VQQLIGAGRRLGREQDGPATGAVVTAGPRVRMGRRVLDLEKRVLVDPADSSEETLTASEFDLLEVFAKIPNRPLQRDWLLEVTAHREIEAFDRAIDLRITRLRRKIELDPTHRSRTDSGTICGPEASVRLAMYASVEEIARIRCRWPKVRILLRGDSGFAREELMAWCEANRKIVQAEK
jgi:hypothetical protein